MFAPRRILVPYDFSDNGNAALDAALSMAHPEGTIHVLYIEAGLDRIIKRDAEDDGESIDDTIAANEAAVQRAVEDSRKRVSAGLPTAEARVRVSGSNVLSVALAMIDELRIDLLVTGTHGREGMMDRLVGSDSEKMVERANCSVLVIKPKGFPYMRD
jgi:nucleotide-binding universal stress UspA family protein